ncbi:MAG: DUF3465 domain-containing protein [Deltaproteobacteria bacterium]|nr:DUF3465 domain-containing protein [Deltaproteobacteria bacterium]
MKKRVLIALTVIICIYGITRLGISIFSQPTRANIQSAEDAYKKHFSNIHVTGSGTVVHILPDDTRGSRHQRFILHLPSGQTLLIAHNIDIAPRIKNLKKGDTVEFSGEYEWNPKGGVVHWTHQDPSRRHIGGWLKHNGRVYK